MTVLSYEFEANEYDLKVQRASRRAASLKKDRAQYQQKSSTSYGRKDSAAPSGSDFATPHRAVRAATRTCLAHGSLAESADMPRTTPGHPGYWVRWTKKPSVSKPSKMPIEEPHSSLVDSGISGTGVEVAQSSFIGKDVVAVANQDEAIVSSMPKDVDLSSETAFPALAPQPGTPSPKSCSSSFSEADSAAVMPKEELTPEKLSQPPVQTETPTNNETETSDVAAGKDELAEEWVVLSHDDAKAATASLTSMKSFDAQHPRNIFGKASTSKSGIPNVDSAAGAGIDWSQAGMPIELIKRLVRGSANPAHHGLHCETKSKQPPLEILRAQNLGSAKRQSSTPKTPRSQSKPRASRASSSRR